MAQDILSGDRWSVEGVALILWLPWHETGGGTARTELWMGKGRRVSWIPFVYTPKILSLARKIIFGKINRKKLVLKNLKAIGKWRIATQGWEI